MKLYLFSNTFGSGGTIMTLLQLQYFAEIYDCGSTLKAAQRLNISQSTVSSAIKTLENELNVTLFDRTPKGLIPNEAGKCLLIHTRLILNEMNLIKTDMKKYSQHYRPIRLGMTVFVCLSYWPDLSISLKDNLPEAEFEVFNDTYSVLLDQLSNNHLDAIIIPLTEPPDDKFNYTDLTFSPQRMISMSINHPLANEKVLSYEQVVNLPLLGYKGDDGKTDSLKREYASLGVELHYAQRCDQMATLIHLLRRNYGVAYLGNTLTKDYTDLVSIPLMDNKKYTLYLIWPKSNIPYGISKKTVRILKEFFSELK